MNYYCLKISFVLLLINGAMVNGQSKSMMIDEKVAIFYPEGFMAKQTLPSLVLTEEPIEKGPLPHTWKTNVTFDLLTGNPTASIAIEPTTSVYGTGEVTGALLRSGTTRTLWNTDNFGYETIHGTRLYQSHPWVLAVRADGTAFGVLADNTWKQEISIGNAIQFTSYGPSFRVIVIEGDSPQEVLKGLAKLTGTMELPPLWSIGFQQCRWSYYPDTRVKEIADTFRVKKIPCDVIWMDIHYMDEYKVFTFSPKLFPNPAALNDYLHQKDFKSIWMIDPGVSATKGYEVYESGTKKDVWVNNKQGEDYLGEVWPGDCVFPDFTQETTVAWWAALYKNFMATGIDGVWNDMNEPSVFNGSGGTMPEDNKHKGGYQNLPMGSHARYHNVYGRLMVEASYKGIKAVNPDKRPFVLTRSNFLGGHRFAATWTGDNKSTWEHMRMSIPMSLNFGLSGQPFNGPDIGGFKGDASPELFGHWIALGAFYPFSRAHTYNQSTHQEPWAFGKDIEAVSRTAMERRYRLLPYFYTLFYEASVNGMPVMRPLFFADPQDIALRTEDQAFLLGDNLMVVPKWARDVALPKGKWCLISLVENEQDGYQPDVYMKEGTIVPLTPIIQSTANYSLDTLTLLISLNESGMAEGMLYSDEGEGYDYKTGAFSLVKFSASKTKEELTVSLEKQDGNLALNSKKIITTIINDTTTITYEVAPKWPLKITL